MLGPVRIRSARLATCIQGVRRDRPCNDTDHSWSQLSIRKGLTCHEGQSVSVNCSHHAIDNAMRMICTKSRQTEAVHIKSTFKTWARNQPREVSRRQQPELLLVQNKPDTRTPPSKGGQLRSSPCVDKLSPLFKPPVIPRMGKAVRCIPKPCPGSCLFSLSEESVKEVIDMYTRGCMSCFQCALLDGTRLPMVIVRRDGSQDSRPRSPRRETDPADHRRRKSISVGGGFGLHVKLDFFNPWPLHQNSNKFSFSKSYQTAIENARAKTVGKFGK